MSGHADQPPADARPTPSSPQHAAPTVSTAPAGHGGRWWSAVPSHLGRARTSTLILAVLFVVIGTLYLNVRPAATSTGTPATGGGGSAPVAPATTSAPSHARTTSSTPAPSTSSVPSTSSLPSTSSVPSTPPSSSTPAAPTTRGGTPGPSSTAVVPSTPTTSAAPTS